MPEQPNMTRPERDIPDGDDNGEGADVSPLGGDINRHPTTGKQELAEAMERSRRGGLVGRIGRSAEQTSISKAENREVRENEPSFTEKLIEIEQKIDDATGKEDLDSLREQREKIVSNASFKEVHNAIIKAGGIRQETRRLLEERQDDLVTEASGHKLFKEAGILLKGVVKENNWSNVLQRFIEKKNELKNTPEVARLYEDNPDWTGMYETVLDGATSLLSLYGIKEMRDRADDEWLAEHGFDNQELARDLTVETEHDYLIDIFGQNLSELVGRDAEQSNLTSSRLEEQLEIMRQHMEDQTKLLEMQVEPWEEIGVKSRVEKWLNNIARKAEKAGITAEEKKELATQFIGNVMRELAVAEDKSRRDRTKSKDVSGDIWQHIEDVVDNLPTNLESTLTDEYWDEVRNVANEELTLRWRLKNYIKARRNVNDRYIEVLNAQGSLAALGLGDQQQLQESIVKTVHEVEPMDFELLFHTDELFPEADILSNAEKRELLPDIDASLCDYGAALAYTFSLPEEFLEDEEKVIVEKIMNASNEINAYLQQNEGNLYPDTIGRHYLPDDRTLRELDVLNERELKVYNRIPFYSRTFNNYAMQRSFIRRVEMVNGSSRGVEMAHRLYEVWLTRYAKDRYRGSISELNEPRKLMYPDSDRVIKWGAKENKVSVEWTIGRYFARDGQWNLISERDAQANPVLLRRRKMLQINYVRAAVHVNTESPNYNGSLVSDFLNTMTVSVPDGVVPGRTVKRSLASYVFMENGETRKGGFKEMPILSLDYGLTMAPYAGSYHGYALGSAQSIVETWSNPIMEKSPEKLTSIETWSGLRDRIFDPIRNISPVLTNEEFRRKGKVIREMLVDAGGFNPNIVSRISGYSNDSDFRMFFDDDVTYKKALAVIHANEEQLRLAQEEAKMFVNETLKDIGYVTVMGEAYPGTLEPKAIIGHGGAESLLSREPVSDGSKRVYIDDMLYAAVSGGLLAPEDFLTARTEIILEMKVGKLPSKYRRGRLLFRNPIGNWKRGTVITDPVTGKQEFVYVNWDPKQFRVE